ncbi:uncharacterized protein UDID_18996 [Ustilago sp. UG-2017a]|nr:uncharacterized protein UDID_18996 [Ustilago sp. UG-2017a]
MYLQAKHTGKLSPPLRVCNGRYAGVSPDDRSDASRYTRSSLQPSNSDHYVLVAVDESDHEFIMAQSSAVVYPPRVAMAPRNVPFIWRFERA